MSFFATDLQCYFLLLSNSHQCSVNCFSVGWHLHGNAKDDIHCYWKQVNHNKFEGEFVVFKLKICGWPSIVAILLILGTNNIHEKISPFWLVKSSAVFSKKVQKRVNSVQKEETNEAFWLINLLVFIYSKLHSKSCDYLYKTGYQKVTGQKRPDWGELSNTETQWNLW